MITTRTGFTYPLRREPSTCSERLVGGDGAHLMRGGRVLVCERPAERLSVDLRDLRRGQLDACYCDRHGGEARALTEIGNDWLLLAPPVVGDAERVQTAGARSLSTREAYVVVRPERPSEGGEVWLAYLGVGSLLQQIENPNPPVRLNKFGEPLTRLRNGKRVPCGAKSFPSREEALRAAVDAWRRNLERVVAEITAARGGTLEWGLEIGPLPEPVVLDVGIGENGWDAAVREPRRGRVGIAAISGLRVSGECA